MAMASMRQFWQAFRKLPIQDVSLASRQQNFHELRVLKGGVLENLPIDFPILWVDFPINLHF
jgi:hypothetical protein